MVEVAPGRRLNLYCSGKGSPTVVLDLGFGAPLLSWGYVQPAVAAVTRVCSYERAGYGFSDVGPLPRTTDAIVGDLHRLLTIAQVVPPYVIVGHSMSGLDAQLFADRYASEVVGMVLIDPLLEGWDEFVERTLPAAKTDDDAFVAGLARCESLAQLGLLESRSPDNRECLPPPDPRFTMQVQAALDATKRRPGHWADLRSEALREDDADVDELRSARRSYGAMPLIVLSAPLDTSLYRHYGAMQQQVDGLSTARNEMRAALARRTTRGIVCQVAGTGHFIQLDRPQVAINAVLQVVALTKAGGSPSCAAL
jgi:pimeloyl-ACP methyl ester carboxylesterase